MNEGKRITRRTLLRAGGMAGAGIWLGSQAATLSFGSAATSSNTSDDRFLDEIERASFEFFWNEASPSTGQVKDRALLNGKDSRLMASIAATGFGLTALCIADHRRYRKHGEIVERGTHRELLALDGRYKQLHDRQQGVEQDQFINPGEDFTASPAQPGQC